MNVSLRTRRRRFAQVHAWPHFQRPIGPASRLFYVVGISLGTQVASCSARQSPTPPPAQPANQGGSGAPHLLGSSVPSDAAADAFDSRGPSRADAGQDMVEVTLAPGGTQGATSHGRFVFTSNDGSAVYTIVKADASAGFLHGDGIVRIK